MSSYKKLTRAQIYAARTLEALLAIGCSYGMACKILEARDKKKRGY